MRIAVTAAYPKLHGGGRPHAPLMVNQLPGSRFAASDLPPGKVPVMFMADWCGYCRRFLPHFKQMQHGYVIDISDESDPLWDTYDIQVVPTVLLFDGNEPVKRWSGVLGPKDAEQIKDAAGA